MFLGLVVASAMIVGLQIPLLHPRSTATLSLVSLKGTGPSLVWPSVGSAALDIPFLDVDESHNDAVVPIASLTKMMTAYVALQKLPLAIGETGPCHVVSADDVTTYDEMSDIDESSVPVAVGEQLCEIDLLNGLLVHSAGNYAVMLANMVAGSNTAFVADMNHDATALGLSGTHYVDASGFSPHSVSTALDQARLAALLMRSALVRSIVIQTSVTLPVAGQEDSFTPFVGEDNVIGVKSGRTDEAGGCDVMAMTFQDGSTTRVLYAVVLGQRGGNLLGPAGDAALALADSAVNGDVHYTFEPDTIVGHLSWGNRSVAFGVQNRREVWWWPAQAPVGIQISFRTFDSSIHRGEVIGSIAVEGFKKHQFKLRALGDLSPPTLLQRLR
jgi:D-alanyl-D-alanine carboxypeptidase (penicillin-binding protein 5/6)